jgi:hypothetical protein
MNKFDPSVNHEPRVLGTAVHPFSFQLDTNLLLLIDLSHPRRMFCGEIALALMQYRFLQSKILECYLTGFEMHMEAMQVEFHAWLKPNTRKLALL